MITLEARQRYTKTGRKGGYGVYAGKSELAKGFKTLALAQEYLDDNIATLSYWAGSATVSVGNTEAVVIHC